jgi:hypothetical protein
MDALREVSGDWIIHSGLWPAHSHIPNLCDFYLSGTTKQEVHRSDHHTIKELKGDIQTEIFSISQEEFQGVNVNF